MKISSHIREKHTLASMASDHHQITSAACWMPAKKQIEELANVFCYCWSFHHFSRINKRYYLLRACYNAFIFPFSNFLQTWWQCKTNLSHTKLNRIGGGQQSACITCPKNGVHQGIALMTWQNFTQLLCLGRCYWMPFASHCLRG